ncbi:BolA family transcriptional regulator [Acidiferrobacter sp.]|uniref:BolA family protein n=1 Tax=Acidiferrobacter sp. TaxID=1872107 RepID=UPI002625747F|nr:BolA family protein [Acidiferrobacter sp.]
MSLQDRITERLKEALAPDEVVVTDDSRQHIGHAGAGNGGHYTVLIIAERFRDRSLLERHRLVYDALADLRKDIHALSIRALVPGDI